MNSVNIGAGLSSHPRGFGFYIGGPRSVRISRNNRERNLFRIESRTVEYPYREDPLDQNVKKRKI